MSSNGICRGFAFKYGKFLTNYLLTIQNLYAAVVSKKQAYDSAAAGYQAAAQSYEAAKRQNALGMLSRANYLGLECSWLSSVASYKTAELEYTKAVENYEWAVRGLIVSK